MLLALRRLKVLLGGAGRVGRSGRGQADLIWAELEDSDVCRRRLKVVLWLRRQSAECLVGWTWLVGGLTKGLRRRLATDGDVRRRLAYTRVLRER